MRLLISDSCFILFHLNTEWLLSPVSISSSQSNTAGIQKPSRNPDGLCCCPRWTWPSPTDLHANECVATGDGLQWVQHQVLSGDVLPEGDEMPLQHAYPHPHPPETPLPGFRSQPHQHRSGSRQLLWLTWKLPDIAGHPLIKRAQPRAKQQPFLVQILQVGLFQLQR